MIRNIPAYGFFLGLLALSATFFLTGCGRFAPPVAPERVAPKAVRDLAAAGTAGMVTISWTTPESDRRDKQLRQIDGFSVYRKTILKERDVTDPDIEFELLAEVKDTAVADREARRLEAIELGAISRRVKFDPERAKHSFEDKTVKNGATYLYKVVPTNQGGVEGGIDQFISVTFRGDTSDIAMVSAAKLGVADFVAEGEAVTP
jgi:hypothetical protein